MPTFAIARVGKLNGWGKVGAAGGHNLRTRPTPNADPARSESNVLLHGPDDLRTAIKDRLAKAGVEPKRKDAVLCSEFILTASPEFFEGKTPAEVRAWADGQTEFLRNRYGSNFVQAVLHMDETTPHVHGMIVPITDDGRLAMKDYISGPARLRQLQTDYAAAMKPYGLDRGVVHSVAKHTEVKEFYADTREARKQPTPQVNIKPRMSAPPTRKVLGIEVDTITRQQAQDYAAEQVTRYQTAKNEALKPFLAERVAMRVAVNQANVKVQQLSRDLRREREGRADERKQAHDTIIGLQNKSMAFDMMRRYSPDLLNAAMVDASAKRRADQEAEAQAKRKREEEEQARRVVQLRPPELQLERQQQPEQEQVKRRQPTLRR